MNWKLLISIILISNLYTLVSAQKSKKTPDEITRINGETFSCRIDSVNSNKIYFMVRSSGNEIKTYLNIEDIASYNHKGGKVYLQDIVITQMSRESVSTLKPKSKPPWKTPGYQLHVDKQPNLIMRLSLMVPGILVEGKIAPHATLVGNIWMGMEYSWKKVNDETFSNLLIYPGIQFEPRFYTNLEARASRGKRVDYFSGTYVSIPGTIVFLGEQNFYQVGVLGGFQRTLGKKGYWNIGVGFGLNSYNEQTSVGMISEFGIGFIVSK